MPKSSVIHNLPLGHCRVIRKSSANRFYRICKKNLFNQTAPWFGKHRKDWRVNCPCMCTAGTGSSVRPLYRWSVSRSASAAGHVKYIWPTTSQNSAPVAALNSRQGDGLNRKGKNPKVCIQLRAADKRRRMRDVVFAEMFVSKYHRCVARLGATQVMIWFHLDFSIFTSPLEKTTLHLAVFWNIWLLVSCCSKL